mmetsp:Transcript_4261/g.7225  ORF Transcript_4261/g.7225 Transcript_4261/m.7225 type:complete len:123 (+) Transcript_4261:150-518(+)|eukprot:CAMPEP_0114423468 /NCGR_PEP_ID=MMETSP0103-20121206/6164_1 /TAXON_ID=37642 ORGANISM="Paraphysomonas imperforata, Strain PA2" /NCGR_SAMPLE_ID=MMETSP0103 /ASSEMBLY_ACC=CAM_ASM_000201 /LENGTH=122 /DNA_ID=CAMNT_0001592131 /DNA_START=142 /DNA_END=510 /DNA_ORIENTATION=+
MRLLTHNSLRSYASDVTNGFPLKLEVGEVEVVQTDCNADFMQHMLPSLSWPAVLVAAAAVGMQGVPETLTPDMLENEDFLLKMHNLLLDIHVIDGALICPESGRRFPISERIPDMRVPEEDL